MLSLLSDRSVFAENVYIQLLALNWIEKNYSNVEFEVYLSILSGLGKPN